MLKDFELEIDKSFEEMEDNSCKYRADRLTLNWEILRFTGNWYLKYSGKYKIKEFYGQA